MSKASSILKKVFGYNSFRPLQEQIIENVLNKQDMLVVMPTGGGKSLCYQIPALIFEGLTIVISPLISLMKDQVNQLTELGVNAVMLNSSLKGKEYFKNFDLVKSGNAKLLYVAPESLLKDDISSLLQSIRVDCITVDEAHCISEWGHDFRKEYRQLASFRKCIPDAVCIAFTATATEKVQGDIIKSLKMIKPKKFVASFNRANLFLSVVPKQNAFLQTVDFIKKHKGEPGIIYCFSRKQVDELHSELSDMGYSTKPYHAGLSDEERHQNQDLFIKDEADIIIATIAFGMGINKPNVRFVLHYDLPKNVESYYQEIGRAGRDGLRADCMLLYSYGDIAKQNYFIEQKESEQQYIIAKEHLRAMVNYAESTVCRRVPLIEYFGEKYSVENCGGCDNCTTAQKDKDDITEEAQKFLSVVKSTGERFGAVYLVDVLTGNENERILKFRHHNLAVFGIGRKYDKNEWQFMIQQFLANKLVVRDPAYNGLVLTSKGHEVLEGALDVYGKLMEKKFVKKKKAVVSAKELAGGAVKSGAAVKSAAASLSASEEEKKLSLFETLKAKRKEIAQQLDVPPYVVFSDKTLQEMCFVRPKDRMSFLSINGVGPQKLETYGEIFITIIKQYGKQKS